MAHRVSVVQDQLKNFEALPDDARVRLPVVNALFGCSNATAWRMCKDGRLPQPAKSGRMTSWRAGDLRKALAAIAE